MPSSTRPILADQLGLEEAIAGSPGWSESGGPWVPASQGMKKYVWSETFVEGGKPFTGTLAHPPSNTGAFQNLGIQDLLTAPEGSKPIPQFYADAAVIAYRAAASDVPVESLHPKVTASAGTLDVAMLSDGDLEKTTKLPIPAAGESAWIQYEFAEPQTMRAVTIVTKNVDMIAAMLSGIANPEISLEASDDGQDFRAIVKLPERWRSRAYGFFSSGDGEVLPRRFQAHTSSSLACMGDRHGPCFPGNQGWPSLPPTMKLPSWCCIRERGSTGSKTRPPSLPCPTSIEFATPPVAPAEADCQVRCG